MVRYATALAADPAATYRAIDIASRTDGADPHTLVALLYDEAVAALRAAAWAVEQRRYDVKNERTTRAIAILFALESNLDFERGGEVSQTLAKLYRSLRDQLIEASVGIDPVPFRRVADTLADVAGAWKGVRGR